MDNQVSTTMHVDRNGEELEITITGYVEPLVHGVFSGPPERCYPDEGGFADLEGAMLNGKHFELTQEEIADAETLLWETYEDDMRDAADMAAEARFEMLYEADFEE